MFRCTLVVLAALTAGCFPTLVELHQREVSRRAAYDFGCAEDQIQVRDIGGNAYAARCTWREQIYNCSGTSTTCVREGTTLPPEDPQPVYVPPYTPPGK